MFFCRPFLLITPLAVAIVLPSGAGAKDKSSDETPAPIKALLVTGGCSHDYTTRKGVIVQGIRERVNRPIEWMVKHEGDGESDVRIPLFEGAEWAKGYDIVVHDYCFPRVRAGDYIDRILAPHRAGLPAVLIHGAMHSFRTGDSRWFDFCGGTSTGHEREYSLTVEPVAAGNPILKGMTPWSMPRGQLYRIDKLATGATALTQSTSKSGEKHVNTWTHLYGSSGTRVFSTTIGNDISTLITPEYLDLLARGFLWALNDLSDSTSVVVPPDQSLQGVEIAIPQTPLPEMGPNETRLGKATALASGETDGTSPGRAIDGKSSTYWESDAPGPASWQVDLPGATPVGAVALIWKDEPPAGFLVEGSRDGRSWRTMVGGSKPVGESTLSMLSFDPLELAHLRVSIPSTLPGYVPGIREFAAYASVEDLPSGLPGALPEENSGIPFQTAGESGFERKVRLAPGWSITASLLWGAGNPVQLIPTASGKVFLLAETAASGTKNDEQRTKNRLPPRSVHLLSPPKDGSLTHSLFLDSLAPGTVVSWDGEWLYTFSRGILNAYRNVAGEGPANERHRLGAVLSLPPTASFDSIQFSDMQTGEDGWFYVRFWSPREWEGYDSRGESVIFPEQGIARFHRNGEQLSWWNDPGTSRGEDAISSGVDEIVQVEGLRTATRDGSFLWLAASDAGGTTLACLKKSDDKPVAPVRWDDLDAASLFDLIDSSQRSVRREVIPEILRRKRNPTSDFERLLSADPSPELAARLLPFLTVARTERSLTILVRMAQSSDPARQALAFRHLGDHPLARNHLVFHEITSATTPAVTIEILRAILRSDTEMEGMDDLVLSFTAHADPGLAAVSREFLISREASATCFEALDDPQQKSHWRGAFDVLAALKRPAVVEGIVLRLEQTNSAEFRRLGLEALCRLYYLDSNRKSEWAGTRIADLFLRASLRDRRVDRPALFNTMLALGIPLPEADVIVELAKEDLSLEALAVEKVIASSSPVSPATQEWLTEIGKSPSRDSDLRSKAAAAGKAIKEQEAGNQEGISSGTLSIEDLLQGIEAADGDIKEGRRLFNQLACGTCHNIHGEGPAFAPDLATSVETLSLNELVEGLTAPAKKVSPGYETRLFELKSGRRVRGLVEGRDSSVVSLRDHAGNPFTVPTAEVRFEWPDPRSIMPSDAVGDLTLPEFASLVQFLKTLAPES